MEGVYRVSKYRQILDNTNIQLIEMLSIEFYCPPNVQKYVDCYMHSNSLLIG